MVAACLPMCVCSDLTCMITVNTFLRRSSMNLKGKCCSISGLICWMLPLATHCHTHYHDHPFHFSSSSKIWLLSNIINNLAYLQMGKCLCGQNSPFSNNRLHLILDPLNSVTICTRPSHVHSIGNLGAYMREESCSTFQAAGLNYFS